MSLTNEEMVLLDKLKAWFSAHFLNDVVEGGCETCGWGGLEGMSLERIRETIDDFIKAGGEI